MLAKVIKWGIGVLVLVGIAYGAYISLRETPVLVDLDTIGSEPMSVTVDEEGVTRVRDVYSVSTPIAGHLERMTLQEGDSVIKGETIASIHPLDPPFLDRRTRTELQAIVEAARSAVALAEVELQRAQAALSLAEARHARNVELAKSRTVSISQVEQSKVDLDIQTAQVKAAEATITLRRAELASAHARLAQPDNEAVASGNGNCCVDIKAPADGIILSLAERSEQAVTVGAQIAQIGDPANLEVVADLLSSDAVRVKPGAAAVISDWGGTENLAATVRRIDPAAFTRVSALGIEEQRVNVVLDVDAVPPALGHGYRVFARLTVWSGDSVLQVPISALFRTGGKWSVFVADGDRAKLQAVSIGHMNDSHAEVLDGLADGDRVVLFPSDQLKDGGLIADRKDTE